jgi:hypothetical protein
VASAIEGFADYVSREVLATSLEAMSSLRDREGYARLKVGASELDVSIVKTIL